MKIRFHNVIDFIAMPCETCLNTISILTPIKHIIYTNKNGNLEYYSV